MTITLNAGSHRERTFPNKAAALRQLQKELNFGGHRMPLESWYMSTDTVVGGKPGWSTWYHMGFKWAMTYEEFFELAKIQQRYGAFCRYIREIEPEWRFTGEKQYWADNSIDAKQVNKYGAERWVKEVAPHGDACF